MGHRYAVMLVALVCSAACEQPGEAHSYYRPAAEPRLPYRPSDSNNDATRVGPEPDAGPADPRDTSAAAPLTHLSTPLAVWPQTVFFSGVPVGEQATLEVHLKAWGAGPVAIREIWMDDPAPRPEAAFELDAGGLEGAVLRPGSEATFEVRYAPSEANRVDASCAIVEDETVVRIRTDDLRREELALTVRGLATAACAPPTIFVAEGPIVAFGIALHLVGCAPYTPDATLSWSVTPHHEKKYFYPTPDVDAPMLVLPHPGEFLVELSAWQQGCSAKTSLTVEAIPVGGIVVSLEWDRFPGLESPSLTESESAPDVDLHFTHPFATGIDFDDDGKPDGSFDNPFDCFWFNPSPDWASHDPMVDDDPTFWHGTDPKTGREWIVYPAPEDGLTYRIGVHYLCGASEVPIPAAVKVYVYGESVLETNAELALSDMWEIADVAWPSGDLTVHSDKDGGPSILPGCQHPLFTQP